MPFEVLHQATLAADTIVGKSRWKSRGQILATPSTGSG
jgi:hypothetical protein